MVKVFEERELELRFGEARAAEFAPRVVRDAPVVEVELFDSWAARGADVQGAVLGLDIADRGYVLHRGQVVLEGTADELGARGDLIDAYLGGARSAGT